MFNTETVTSWFVPVTVVFAGFFFLESQGEQCELKYHFIKTENHSGHCLCSK